VNRVGRGARPLVLAGLVTALVMSVTASSANVRSASLPQETYAPYFETWAGGSLSATATLSGARYFTMAFVQAPYKGSCTPTWNGNPQQPVASASFGSQINQLRNLGGDVIVSFGGAAADNSGTEIADSCGSVTQIAAAYETVVSSYGVTRLDMDIEGQSLTNPAGINRRDLALKLTEAWAAQHGIPLQVQYTLPVTARGLPAKCLAVLQNAAADGAKVSVVNGMAFDYLHPNEGRVDMGAAAIGALQSLHTQLSQLYPSASSANIWGMEGVTLLPGIDSAPGQTEVTSLGDAAQVLSFAQANHINLISIWAIQRDNGNCPGVSDSSRCSGITQNTWAFSQLLSPFTSSS
jgi:hypothetical protein